jgi:Fe-S-cluster containining protein
MSKHFQAEIPRKVDYDCSKCPGYCCSYPRIEVKDKDLKRLARHFDVDVATAERRFTRFYRDGAAVERILRHQKDEIYGSICRFFDTDARRCTIYEARPSVCRDYPNGRRCGYYTFLRFERKHQDDKTFIPSA